MCLFHVQRVLMETGACGPRGLRARPRVAKETSRGSVSATTPRRRKEVEFAPAATGRHNLATTHSAPVSIRAQMHTQPAPPD